MVIGRGELDAPGLDRLAVLAMGGRQRPMPAQDFRQGTGPSRRQVEDHEHGGRKIIWQRGGQVSKRSTPPAEAPTTTMPWLTASAIVAPVPASSTQLQIAIPSTSCRPASLAASARYCARRRRW
jgi:hypothetical protein